jgi:RHS repeat-associated protein
VALADNRQPSASYVQNGLGQRVIKVNKATGETLHYHYDLSGRLLAESTDKGQVIREYLYRDDQLVGLISEGLLYYVHTNHLGAPQLITDSSQQVVWAADYMPFGEAAVTVNQLENPIRFPGQYYDGEMGTHYNYYRNYDPSLGRYIQSDPIGLEGGLNRYGYVDGNPLVYIDPDGLRGVPALPPRIIRLYPNGRKSRATHDALSSLPDNVGAFPTGKSGGGACGPIFGCSLPWIEVEVCDCPNLEVSNSCRSPSELSFRADKRSDPSCFCYKKRIVDTSRL